MRIDDGSVKLTLRLPREKVERLMALVREWDQGHIHDVQVLSREAALKVASMTMVEAAEPMPVKDPSGTSLGAIELVNCIHGMMLAPQDEDRSEALCDAIRDHIADKLVRIVRRAVFWYSRERVRQMCEEVEASVLADGVQLCREGRIDLERSPGEIAAYLNTMARNRMKDRINEEIRHEQREASLTSGDEAQLVIEGQAPLDQVIERELSERVRAALAQLPERDRRIIELFTRDGLSHGEIAERLNMRRGSTQVAYSRAIRKLREHLDAE